MDAAYARFLAKRLEREREAAQAAAEGKVKGQPGIKLSRRAKLSQQALVTQASLDGSLAAEQDKYVKLLAGARGSSSTAAVGAGEGAGGAARDGDAFYGAGEDDDSDSDGADSDISSDASYTDAEMDGAGGNSKAAERGAAAPAATAAAAAAGGGGGGGGAPPVARPAASASAARWFSNPVFADALAQEQMEAGGLNAADAAAEGGKRSGASAARGGRVGVGAKRLRAGSAARAANVSSGSEDSSDQGGVDSDGDIDPLANIAPSDRDKWRTRLRKRRERAERSAARRAAKDDMQVVKAAAGAVGDDADEEFARVQHALAREERGAAPVSDSADDDDEDGGDGGDRTRPLSRKELAARDLIRAGMGRAIQGVVDTGSSLTAAAGAAAAASAPSATGKKRGRTTDSTAPSAPSSSFEVVPQRADDVETVEKGNADDGSDSDSDAVSDDSGPDPRDDIHDPDERAEILALGKMLKRHSSAKALLDASYNRYAFEDGLAAGSALPLWFTQDEDRHFKPQLPINKADVDRIKAQFRDIAARPITKVLEARGRKRRRLETKVAAAKKKAESILDSDELGAQSKQRSIARLMRTAKSSAKQKSVYAVFGRSGQKASVGAKGRGTKVVPVDGRLKKEKRAAKRTITGKKGRR